MTTPKKKVTTATNIELVSWKNHIRKGSRFSKEVEPAMLNEDCQRYSKGVNGAAFVNYGRDYVKAKICHTIFSRLGLRSYEEYETLLKESWEFYQSGEYEMSR